MSISTYRRQLGEQLRARRRLLGLNQTEVADLAGTTQRSVSQTERGSAAGLDLYGAIAEVLGLELVAIARDQLPDDARQSAP